MSTILITTLISILISLPLKTSSYNNSINATYEQKRLLGKLFLSFIPIWIITCFRWSDRYFGDTGYLTGSYWKFYENCINHNNRLFDILQREEPFVWGSIKIATMFGIGWFKILLILSTEYIIAFIYFLGRNCRIPFLGICLYSFLGLFLFPFHALRQAASEIFILIAYDIMLHKKTNSKYTLLKACVVLFLGMIAHTSCIIMIPLFIIANKHYKLKNLFLFTFLFVILSPFCGFILQSIISILRPSYSERLMNEARSFNITYVILGAFFVYICILNIKKNYPQSYFCINLVFLYFISTFYSKFLLDPYRIIHMFSPIIIVSVCRIIESLQKKSNKIIIKYMLLLILFILFIKNFNNYLYISAISNLSFIKGL